METTETLAQKIAHYQVEPAKVDHVKHVPMLLAVGITAAGKDTVLRQLMSQYPGEYRRTVSHTTRKQRYENGIKEQDGAKYYFIDKAEANQRLDQGRFLEVNYFASNLYGTSIAEVERAEQEHKILVSDIDVNGIANFVRLGMNVKPVFLLPPDFATWRQRLRARYQGEINKEDMRKRLQTALDELQDAIEHQYYYLVVNDDLNKTVQLVNDIAHGRITQAHYPKAVALAQQLADDITQALQKL